MLQQRKEKRKKSRVSIINQTRKWELQHECSMTFLNGRDVEKLDLKLELETNKNLRSHTRTSQLGC